MVHSINVLIVQFLKQASSSRSQMKKNLFKTTIEDLLVFLLLMVCNSSVLINLCAFLKVIFRELELSRVPHNDCNCQIP